MFSLFKDYDHKQNFAKFFFCCYIYFKTENITGNCSYSSFLLAYEYLSGKQL